MLLVLGCVGGIIAAGIVAVILLATYFPESED